jgi:ABC-type nitrate/sulfonate/bicarbonate transport system substrate-binding protein
MTRNVRLAVLVCVAVLALAATPAFAETLRVGTAVPNSFTFLPLRLGITNGFYAKEGLDIAVTDFQGGAKVHQGMMADVIDMAVAGATDFQFLAKGSPELAVAAKSSRPPIGVIVRWDYPGKTADDLKGAKLGITTVGSLTEWLMHRLMRQKGWSQSDVTLVPIGGSFESQLALMTTGEIDGCLGSPGIGLELALTKRGRLLLPSFDVGSDFLAEVIFASKKILGKDPDGVRRFLKAWFENIAWMRAHKDEAVEMIRAYTKFSRGVESQEYDQQMPYLSSDGKFHAAALTGLQQAFVEMGTFEKPPEMAQFYTETYLPRTQP